MYWSYFLLRRTILQSSQNNNAHSKATSTPNVRRQHRLFKRRFVCAFNIKISRFVQFSFEGKESTDANRLHTIDKKFLSIRPSGERAANKKHAKIRKTGKRRQDDMKRQTAWNRFGECSNRTN